MREGEQVVGEMRGAGECLTHVEGNDDGHLDHVEICIELSSPVLAVGLRNVLESAGATIASRAGAPGVVCITDDPVLPDEAGSSVLLLVDPSQPPRSRGVTAGVRAVCSRNDSADTIVFAVRALSAGHMFIGRSVLESFGALAGRSNVLPDEQLSGREEEVLSRLIVGDSTDEIARAMCLSVRTVKLHVGSILRKYGVKTRAVAVAVATGNRRPVPAPALAAR